MLSEINTGKRRKRDNEVYPLRELTQGRILTQQQVLEIVDLLKNDFISNTEIAKRYNVSAATIQAINIKKVLNMFRDLPRKKRLTFNALPKVLQLCVRYVQAMKRL